MFHDYSLKLITISRSYPGLDSQRGCIVEYKIMTSSLTHQKHWQHSYILCSARVSVIAQWRLKGQRASFLKGINF